VRAIRWTLRARQDLASIRAFVEQDAPVLASVVVSRIIAATDRLASFPESGRLVPELPGGGLREVIHTPYRIVYRLVDGEEVHILTVHQSAKRFPRFPWESRLPLTVALRETPRTNAVLLRAEEP